MDNHVAIYGSKVAEGFSAFQRRLVNTWLQWIGQRPLQDETRTSKFWDLLRLILEIYRYPPDLCGPASVTQAGGHEYLSNLCTSLVEDVTFFGVNLWNPKSYVTTIC